MKNVWKGLVIGGLTGMAGGLFLDGLDRGARGAAALSNRAAEEVPEVAGHLRDAIADTVAETAGRVRDSGVPDHAKEISGAALRRSNEVATTGKNKAAASTSKARAKAQGIGR
jgi:hypothetical protein